MKKLTILCDLDAMLVDLHGPWFAEYNRRFKDDLTEEKVLSFNVALYARAGVEVFSIFNDAGFFRSLPPIPGGLEAMKSLYEDGHDIVIVTASPNAGAATEKTLWVQEHLPFLSHTDLILAHKKHLIRGDVFLDDSPSNIDNYWDCWPNAKIGTIAYPYNQKAHSSCDKVAFDYKDPACAWSQLLAWVRGYAKEIGETDDTEAA